MCVCGGGVNNSLPCLISVEVVYGTSVANNSTKCSPSLVLKVLLSSISSLVEFAPLPLSHTLYGNSKCSVLTCVFACVSLCGYLHMSQVRTLACLELKLQTVWSDPVWMLRTEAGSLQEPRVSTLRTEPALPPLCGSVLFQGQFFLYTQVGL